jgi:hypothetical protein
MATRPPCFRLHHRFHTAEVPAPAVCPDSLFSLVPQDAVRTVDLPLTRRLLCQLSYKGKILFSFRLHPDAKSPGAPGQSLHRCAQKRHTNTCTPRAPQSFCPDAPEMNVENFHFPQWSRRRDSNPRPRRWQRRALPAELRLQFAEPVPSIQLGWGLDAELLKSLPPRESMLQRCRGTSPLAVVCFGCHPKARVKNVRTRKKARILLDSGPLLECLGGERLGACPSRFHSILIAIQRKAGGVVLNRPACAKRG